MRKLLKFLLGVLVVVICAVAVFFLYNRIGKDYQHTLTYPKPNTSDVSSLRIGTYNIKSLAMGSALDQFVSDVEALDLDVICLQEVDHQAWRSGHQNMVKELAEASGYAYSYFYKSLWLVDGDYGLGILSKYPIKEVSSQLLPTSLLEEPRILAGARLDVNGKDLQIYNTHLAYKNQTDHEQQIEVLQSILTNQKNTILCGDFNSFRGTFEIEGMKRINWDTPSYVTFRDFGTPDNIFYSSNFQQTLADVKQTSFSDHHVLYTQLDITSLS